MIIDSCVWKFFWGGADLRRGTNGGEGGGIFYEKSYHKILLRGGGGVGRGIWRGNFGSNRGYFIKIV